jgi:hypothetical protein
MVSWAFLVYIGGVFAMPDRKLGFFRRLSWPMEIGEYLAEKVMK